MQWDSNLRTQGKLMNPWEAMFSCVHNTQEISSFRCSDWFMTRKWFAKYFSPRSSRSEKKGIYNHLDR